MITCNQIITDRLILNQVAETDHAFIKDLLNSAGWLKYIGERNINSTEDAISYIQKIIANTSVNYFIATIKDSKLPAGIVTLIQRDYLDHPDIGFAFLPVHENKGYAYEASKALMNVLLLKGDTKTIHAVTLPYNKSSIKLIEKIGLRYDREIRINDEVLHIYTAETAQLLKFFTD